MRIKTWTSPDLVVHNINDGTNYDSVLLKDAYGLPTVSAIMGQRQGYWPILGAIDRPGKQLFIHVIIAGSPLDTLQTQLSQWFDPDDEEEGTLIVEDDAGGNDRYVEAVCESMNMINNTSGIEWLITLRISEDVFLRDITLSNTSWSITASGQTKVVTNDGDMDSFPILTITPTSQRTSGGYRKKRFITVLWDLAVSAVSYPTDIVNNAFDTAAEVTGGDMQADGDDLRVFVGAVEIDRWLDDINTTNTSVWCNLDFAAAISLTLDGAIGAADSELVVNESISRLPGSGILKIESELISYTSKNNQTKTIEGLTRGTRGTTGATHADAIAAEWVQHDIWILYDNSSAVAPVTDDDFKPVFDLALSSNTTWDYDTFLEDDGLRTGSWLFALTSVVHKYGGNRGVQADPWVELGLNHDGIRPVAGSWGRVYIYNPAGISSIAFSNGEKFADDHTQWTNGTTNVQSSVNGVIWKDHFNIPAPTSSGAWESWSASQATVAGAKYAGLLVDIHLDNMWIEASNAQIVLATNPFTITIGAEIASYSLAATITNNTTGDVISLAFPMSLNEDLVVNTDEKTLVYDFDGTNQFSALTVVGGPRRDWLPLQPGSNTLQYDEIGAAGVDIVIDQEERYYQ